jgi:hypothetical protein
MAITRGFIFSNTRKPLSDFIVCCNAQSYFVASRLRFARSLIGQTAPCEVTPSYAGYHRWANRERKVYHRVNECAPLYL